MWAPCSNANAVSTSIEVRADLAQAAVDHRGELAHGVHLVGADARGGDGVEFDRYAELHECG